MTRDVKEIEISAEPVELYKVLKLADLVASGGEAKHVIVQGLVRVNGVVETRKRKKIFAGDIVGFGDLRFTVLVRNE